MAIPIIFCIDVEPDARVVPRDDAPLWVGYERSFEFLAEMRGPLGDATGADVHYNWFYRLDPQVELCYGSAAWPITHYDEYFAALDKAGDELGLHPHAWHWDEVKNDWVADHANQPYIDECLEMCVSTYTETVGKPPLSFRFGDRFYNEATSRRAEALGLKYDLTAEPGSKPVDAIVMDGTENYTGQLGDFTNMPTFPYHRSADDWKTPDASRADGMWIVPLSSGVPESNLGRMKRIAKSILGNNAERPEIATMNLSRHVATNMLIANRIIASSPKPYLACVIRANDLAKPDSRERIDGALRALAAHGRAKDFRFMRPDEAIDALEIS